MTDQLCEVAITAPDADWLAAFVRRLVEDHLCASAHTLAPGISAYEWSGELVERPEARATLRTRASLVPRISERLDREHPYELPGIVALPILATSPAYEAWVFHQTAQAAST